jgi:acyl-coenzyme A synthetase/AMP-(fatty) acid ligase
MQSETDTRLTERMTALLKAPVWPQNLFCEDRTYQDIYNLAGGLRAALMDHENPTQPVCLYTGDTALTAAAMLTAAAEGAPPILLPYALNPTVLQEIQASTGACRVVSDQPLDLPPPMIPVAFSPGPYPSPGLNAAPVDKVIVRLFTGGSTGKPQVWPKTVVNLFGEAYFMVEKFNFSPKDCFVTTTVPYHIYGLLFAVLIPLVASARVAGGPSIYPQDITDAIARHKTTVLAGVPSHYRVLRDVTFQADHLRLAISSAGRLEPEDGTAFFRQTGVGVTEIYGSTETGGVATRNRANDETTLIPLASVAIRIADERLWVRSPYLSPSLETDTDGFFLTGDRVQGNADHGFMLMGRADGIVKVGGKRVDLEGVQSCLKDLPGIADALVLALSTDRARENEIVAVVEAVSKGEMDVLAIRQALADKVEPYALPRRMVTVDKIPMSATGKYDRQASEAFFTNV